MIYVLFLVKVFSPKLNGELMWYELTSSQLLAFCYSILGLYLDFQHSCML